MEQALAKYAGRYRHILQYCNSGIAVGQFHRNLQDQPSLEKSFLAKRLGFIWQVCRKVI